MEGIKIDIQSIRADLLGIISEKLITISDKDIFKTAAFLLEIPDDVEMKLQQLNFNTAVLADAVMSISTQVKNRDAENNQFMNEIFFNQE